MISKLLSTKLKNMIFNQLHLQDLHQINKFKIKFNKSSFYKFSANGDYSTRRIFGPFKENNLKGYINYFRKHSHKYANINPLIINPQKIPDAFSAEYWGLSQVQKIEDFALDETFTYTNDITHNLQNIKDLENFLKKMYLLNIGVEFEHLDSEEEKLWLYENFEYSISQELHNIELENTFKCLYGAFVKKNLLKKL